MKRTTIFLPEEVHARLRSEAHRSHLSMAELIRGKLTSTAAEPGLSEEDPLLAVAGLWSDGTLCANLDEEFYER